MPLDLSGFKNEPNQWAGLFHVADQMEKRKLRQDQLDLQKQTKRAAAGSFLQKYLDPKDMLTGTDYDPMLLQGLEALSQTGSQLAYAGADPTMLMMALGPGVNKLSSYATNAKNINKRIDEQLKGMKDSGMAGYNYSALKQEALKNAFYKTDDKGQSQMDPDNFDPSVDYVAQAIQKNPLAVTTEDVFDEFAKKAEKKTTTADVTSYTPAGTTFRSKADLTAAGYMVPETVWDPKAGKSGEHVTTGFVPKYEVAKDRGNELLFDFQKDGKTTRAPIRLLDEQEYDKGLWPAMHDRIRGMVQEHLSAYEKKTGNKIAIDSPEAKDVGRAFAYDMLNVDSRKGGSIKHLEQQGKLSPQQISLNINQSPAGLQNVEDRAAAAKRGRNSEPTQAEQDRQSKRNFGEALADVFTGKEDIAESAKVKLNGEVYTPDGKKKPVKDFKVIDITGSMPGGGIKAGTGANHTFGAVYFSPESSAVIIEKEEGPQGNKQTNYMEIPEANFGQFINRYAEANGMNKAGTKAFLERIGYSGGKFKRSNKAVQPNPAAEGFKEAKKQKPWREAAQKTLEAIKNPFGPSATTK